MRSIRVLLIVGVCLVGSCFKSSGQDSRFRVFAGINNVLINETAKPCLSMNLDASVKVLNITQSLSLQSGVSVDWASIYKTEWQDNDGVMSLQVVRNDAFYAGIPANIVCKSIDQKSLFSLKFYNEYVVGLYFAWPVYAKELNPTSATSLNLEYRMVYDHLVVGLRARLMPGVVTGVTVGYQF